MERFDNRVKNTVGSSRIRCRWLIELWPEAEEYHVARKYDVMIYQKVYWQAMMEQFQGIQILDICDPDWLEKKPVFEFMDLADAVVTSTEPLAEYIRKLRPKKEVRCIPDRIYLPEHQPIKQTHNDDMKSVVWYGYHQNFHYLYKTVDELFRNSLELFVIADQPFELPMSLRGLKVTNIPYSYPSLHQELIKHDAMIMPAPNDDEKGKFKSNNKTLTGWALGLPVIRMPDDLKRLKSKASREAEAKEKLIEIGKEWDVKYSVLEYQRLIDDLWKKTK